MITYITISYINYISLYQNRGRRSDSVRRTIAGLQADSLLHNLHNAHAHKI